MKLLTTFEKKYATKSENRNKLYFSCMEKKSIMS